MSNGIIKIIFSITLTANCAIMSDFKKKKKKKIPNFMFTHDSDHISPKVSKIPKSLKIQLILVLIHIGVIVYSNIIR